MKTRKSIQLIILLIVALQLPLFAQSQNFRENVSKRGTTAASFLEIGVGARALAMGGAFTATADDPSAMYWNVGGIAKMDRVSLFLNHTEWIADTQFEYLGVIMPVAGFGTIGISLSALTMNEMQVTTVDQPEGTGQMFGAGDYAFSVAYAVNLTERFSIGFNPKVIYQYIWDMTAVGFGIDLGVHYVTPFEGVTIGFAMTNFGPKMAIDGDNNRVLYDYDPNSSGNNERLPARLETSSWPLPLNFKLGIQYTALQSEEHKAIVAIDAQHPNNNYESINMGVEYVYGERYALRAGYRSMFLTESEESFTFGGGIAYPLLGNIMVHADYAFADFGILENVHKFSLSLDF